MLALQLAMASLQVRWKVWRYEISRWILVASMLFFSVHYLLQMIHGLRAQGTDVGAAFNILFYTPVAFAITLSIINIESTGSKVRRYCLRSMMAYILIAIVFVIGMFKNNSLHIGNMLYVDAENHTWTTDNFLKAVQAVYDSGKTDVGAIYCSGQGGDQGTRAIINNMYGGTFTDAAHTKYTADSPENIKAIQALYDAKGVNFDASINGGEEITLFRNGTLQMAFCWNIAQQLNSDNNDAGLTNSGDEIFPMAFPTESGDPKLCGGIWGFGIFDNGDEAKIEAAKTFIDFIAADPDQVGASVLASTYFPVRESVGDIYAGNDIMSEYSKFMNYLGDYYQITPGWATARTEWWNMLQRVGTGEAVETAVATFVQNANAAATAEA